MLGDPKATERGNAASETSTSDSQPPAKSQPWRKFWAPGESLTLDKTSNPSQSPWLYWKPDPNKPDEKPWIKWMNNKEFNPAYDERTGRYMERVRGPRNPSPRATVAEGG